MRNRLAIQRQFGPVAAAYVASASHAGEFTLQCVVDLADPEPHWVALDVATGGGHVAIALGPRVRRVVACDITPQMLEAATEHAQARGVTNIVFEDADAMDLPYGDGDFDLVTCRIAAHHFPDVDRFLAEARRVLRPGGRLVVADTCLPADDSGEFVNAFQKLHDPSHVRCLSADEWQSAITFAGLDVTHREVRETSLDFESWMARMRVGPETERELREMLEKAPAGAAAILRPRLESGRMIFHFPRLLLAARRRGDGTERERAP